MRHSVLGDRDFPGGSCRKRAHSVVGIGQTQPSSEPCEYGPKVQGETPYYGYSPCCRAIAEACPEHYIQLLHLERGYHARYIDGSVLPVCIEGDHISSFWQSQGVGDTGRQCGALPQIPDVPEEADVEASSLSRRVVARSIIYHDHPVWKRYQLLENTRQCRAFIVGRHHDTNVRSLDWAMTMRGKGGGWTGNTISHTRSTLGPYVESPRETVDGAGRLHPMITAERLDPLLTATGSDYDREALRLHLERYEYAAARVADKLVVDCACGTGYGSATLARAGAAAVVGVDIDDAAVAYARRNHAHERVTYVVGDAATYMPPFLPEVWVTLETVEHLVDPEAYLRTAWRRLAPDALLIASVPTTVSTDGNPFHLTDFTRKSWHRLLAATGFVAEDELVQTHRYSLKQIFGAGRGERQRQVRRNLLAYYAAHPSVAWARAALTARRGLVHEYTTVVARRASQPHKINRSTG